MSPLAFDKQGKPFAWHRRTRKLLVRMFRNPAARGTCCQVLDAEGNPLYIDAETEYGEFRKAVGNVPGLYRLDQCDDDGVEIDEAQPAYVSIDLSRNASLAGDGGEVDPLVIIEHMFAIHADVMKTMAMQQASIMAASAEILRAPFRPAAPAVARDPRDEDDKDDEDDDDEEDELEPDPWASWRPMLEMVEPHLPKLGAFLLAQFVAFMKTATPPAATPIPSPGPAPAPNSAATPIQSAEATGAAAGSSPASSTSAPSSTSTPTPSSSTAAASPAGPPGARVDNGPTPGGVADGETDTPSHPIAPSTPATTNVASTQIVAATATATTSSTGTSTPSSAGTALAIAPSAPTGSPRNAPPAPTPDQWEHLHEIRERLSPKERAIAENAIMRMDADLLARYLADLSAQSVDDAVATIRSMIAKLPATRGRERG
jgi:hypothetical protein